jgi:acetyltransferase-like isoleucine patch superfamily enzyme
MKKYTQADFDNFKVDEYGHKICPTGDYTAIKDFVEYCVFNGHCLFGAQCRFIAHCRFGDGCYFGDGCSFGAYCYFGTGCEFGKGCHFGELCGFGEGSTFGEWCSFGERCSFCARCSYENGAVKNGRYVAVDRIGRENRKAYFYIDENGNMFVRAGCWFSDMDAFKERVKEVHAGTIHEKTYLAACDLAELMLKGDNEK